MLDLLIVYGLGNFVSINKKFATREYIKILQGNLLEVGENLIGKNFIFQEDNNLRQKAMLSESWRERHNIRLLYYPR